MENCPVCGGHISFAKPCDVCGFDLSCDYEGHRTLCSSLPGWAEPVSVRAAKQKRRKQRMVAISPDDLMCPRCGGKRFLLLIDELQFMCAACGAKKSATVQVDAVPVGTDKAAEKRTAEADGPAHGDVLKYDPYSRIRPVIAAGWCHTVGVKGDGTVAAVGNNTDGQCDVSGWRDVVAVAAGNDHTAGLKKDGTVVAVGKNDWGQCNVSGWRDIVAIAAGRAHTVGLKKDGTVVAAGSDSSGRCNVYGWRDIVAIAAGSNHTAGLKKDGTVIAVGNNDKGQTDVGKYATRMESSMFGLSSKVVRVKQTPWKLF